MRLMAGPLAPSESKMRFMNRLGLDLENHNHRRLYKAMKSDAVASYLQMTGQRDALLPQLQGDKSVVAPYTYAQVSETALHRAILGMYARADDEIRAYYDLGRNTDGIEEENWVIRWLLWHVFRYRDRRNRAGGKDSGKPRRTNDMDDDSDTPISATSDSRVYSRADTAWPQSPVVRQPLHVISSSRLPYDPARDC